MAKSARISLLVVIVALAGACGSSDNGLSKAEFVKRADAICAASNKKFDAVSATVGHDTSIGAAPEALPGAVRARSARSEIEQLRALKPPKADRDDDLEDARRPLERRRLSSSRQVAAVKSTAELVQDQVAGERRGGHERGEGVRVDRVR